MTMTKPTSEQVTFTASGAGATLRNLVDKVREVVSVKDFGAVGDGVADDTAAIQAAIDWVVYNNLPYNATQPRVSPGALYFPGGTYRITDTLHLGYGIPGGQQFSCIRIYGDGRRYLNVSSLKGTSIVADFNDRPAIAVSAGRMTAIESMSVIGRAATWMTTNRLGNPNPGPLIDDTVAANWIDPAFPASASSRYAPYCGIAIDPYAGVRPAVSYPDVNFPSWLNWTTQYGKGFSDGTRINDVEIYGFVVGVAVQPSDVDGNGDYTTMTNCRIQSCAYGVSVGNSQARDFGILNTQFQTFYAALITNLNGKQNGMPAFSLTNCSYLFGMIGAIIPNLNFASQVGFYNVYSEGLWKIGIFGGGGGGTAGSVTFQECEFRMEGWNVRGIPASALECNVSLTLIGTTIWTTSQPSTGKQPTLLLISCPSTKLAVINCFFYTEANPTFLYEKQAQNATRGMVTFDGGTNLSSWSLRNPRVWDMTTGSFVPDASPIAHERTLDVVRRTCIPVYAKHALTGNPSDGGFALPGRNGGNFLIDKAACASLTQSGNSVTINTTGAISTADTLMQLGGDVGDIVIDSATQTVFIVAARTGLTLTLIAQNNTNASNNLAVTIAASGYMHTINCRLFGLSSVHYGDISSSSTTISNVVNADGTARNLNDAQLGVQAGDAMFVGTGTGPSICNPANAPITGVTSNSITITGNPYYTQTRDRLTLFVKQPTANNT